MSGTPLQFVRDKEGHPASWERDLVAAVDTFEMPECWPASVDECRRWLIDYARVYGAAVALGYTTTDAAYSWVRGACQSVQDSTMGRLRVSDAFPLYAQMIDDASQRVGEYVARIDASSFWSLRSVAVAAISSGQSDQDVRQALAAAAISIDPPPPESLLHEVLAAAVSECRRNARWMSTREIPA